MANRNKNKNMSNKTKDADVQSSNTSSKTSGQGKTRNRNRGGQAQTSSAKDSKYAQSGNHVGGESAIPQTGKEAYDAAQQKGKNDLNFYVVSEQILRDVATMAWNQATGTRINLHNPLFSSLTNQGSFCVPGIYNLWLAPSFGRSTDNVSALNVAAHYMYTFVRHANSGARNYDPVDLMIAVLGTAEVFSSIEFAKRLYRVIGEYQFFNRYTPDAILSSWGVSAKEMRKQLPQFRARLNLAIRSLRLFAVPSTLPIFGRRVQVFSSVYREGDSVKDQMYAYVPEGFYKFGLDSDGAGQLVFESWDQHHTPGALMNPDDICTWIEQMVNQVLAIPDISLIMGDVVKAYGSNLITMPELDENEALTISTDLNVLEQMKNATVLATRDQKWTYTYPALHQDADKGKLIFEPQLAAVNNSANSDYVNTMNRNILQAYTEDRLLSTIRISPTPGDLMEMTRLTVAANNFKQQADLSSATVDLITGSEVVVHSSSVSFEFNAQEQLTLGENDLSYYMMYDTTAADAAQLVREFRLFARTSNFKFHPALHFLAFRQSSTNPAAINVADAYFFFDVDNFMDIQFVEIEQLHNAALLAEFGLK